MVVTNCQSTIVLLFSCWKNFPCMYPAVRNLLDSQIGFLPEILYFLTDFMKHCASCKANSCSSRHEVRRLLWKREVCYRVHKSPPLIPILSYIDSVQTSSFKVHFNLNFQFTPKCSMWPWPFGLSDSNFVCISLFPVYDTPLIFRYGLNNWWKLHIIKHVTQLSSLLTHSFIVKLLKDPQFV